MNDLELGEIKERAEQARKLLEEDSSLQLLVQGDVFDLLAEIDQLRDDLAGARDCPHGESYREKSCIRCFGDGTEELKECSGCGSEKWHRGGKCLGHDESAPKPYELLKKELDDLRHRVHEIQEGCSKRVTEVEERLREIEGACALMRESLEYVKGRLGSTNLGESMYKINQALSSSSKLLDTSNGVEES